ncbi:MAG: tetratricopeptide repeat protein, partial [Kovacikia sp.]
MANLTRFDLQEQVFFCCQDMEEFFADLRDAGLEDKIGVYFYNGASDYRSQLLGLLLAKPFLADQALIVVSQADVSMVRQAASDFLVAHAQARLLLDLSTVNLGYSAFGQGLLVLGWDVTPAQPTTPFDWRQWRDENTIRAIQGLEQQQRTARLEALKKEAVMLVAEGKVAEAEHKYQTFLLTDRNNGEVWQNLGMLYFLAGKDAAAFDALTTSLSLNPDNALAHYFCGLVLERANLVEQAIEAHQRAISLEPSYRDALNHLGNLLMKQKQFSQAEELFRRSIAADPTQLASYTHLGDALMGQEHPEAAIVHYQKAISFNGRAVDVWQKISTAYRAIGNIDQANFTSLYALYHEHRHQEVVEQFQTYFEIDQLNSLNDCFILRDCFFNCGLTQQAIQCVERASLICPEDYFLRIASSLVLPAIYQTPEEMTFYRQRYLQGYDTLMQWVEDAAEKAEAFNITCVENFMNFYLCYQGLNDRPIHDHYGKLIHQLAAENYPQLASTFSIPPLRDGKIRIGYIAESLGNNSETRWALGWLKNHDRSQFEIYCYSINSNSDLRTGQFKLLSDAFYHLPNNLEATCEQIRSDQLH